MHSTQAADQISLSNVCACFRSNVHTSTNERLKIFYTAAEYSDLSLNTALAPGASGL